MSDVVGERRCRGGKSGWGLAMGRAMVTTSIMKGQWTMLERQDDRRAGGQKKEMRRTKSHEPRRKGEGATMARTYDAHSQKADVTRTRNNGQNDSLTGRTRADPSL